MHSSSFSPSLFALLIALLLVAISVPCWGWVADTPSGYIVSSSVVVNGSISVVDNNEQVDLFIMLQQLQAQVRLLQTVVSTAPTVQLFTMIGSGVYTPSQPNPLYIRVRLVGGGGGGSGAGTTGTPSPGTAGNFTSFGSSLLVAQGGAGGQAVAGGGQGGAGGSASIGAGAMGVSFSGSVGGGANYQNTAVNNLAGGTGGTSPFGGAGSGSYSGVSQGAASSGSGGGGGSTGAIADCASGAGGGSGGFIDAIIPNPGTAYEYSVGSGGAGGNAGSGSPVSPGSNGASGVIVVEEFYH
jgi:hypothetical protein